MRKFFPLVCVLVALIVFSVAWNYIQNAELAMDEERVTNLIARVYEAPADKFRVKQLDGPHGRGFRVVFAYNGMHYTFDHDWWVDGVYIWMHRLTRLPPDAFADRDMDGIVDFGTDGQDKIFAVANFYEEGSAARGLEHQPYWQGIYGEAFVGLEVTLDGQVIAGE